MNKAELIDALATELGESKAGSERILNTVLDTIKKGIKEERIVQIIGFGTFTMRERGARPGRNPATGEILEIKASKTVTFKPSSAFKNSL